MHEAVPPGGALVPELLALANARVDNPPGAAAIEVLGRLVIRATADVAVATEESARVLRAGEPLTVAAGARRCSYLAVRGGVDAPERLGGRGTLICAGIGRPLRAGDSIHRDVLPACVERAEPFEDRDTVRVIPGPDLEAFATGSLERLVSAPYRILPNSDRTGTRLSGPALGRAAGARERSAPLVRGALEVPADLQPIVLGPEHPTTGGYPVIGVIAASDLGRFFAIRPGGHVRFSVRA